MAHRRKVLALPPLHGVQAKSSDPASQVRLSASAGTGKTQVLSARVLRLLLHGAAPESILCLTFTKGGATEMADRIHERLGAWVTMKDSELFRDLESLGEQTGRSVYGHARTLFARVLDARGSGLRIQTIHSFCQTLLAAFPAEAGLAPGFRPIEGREADQLAAKALSDMVVRFIAEGRLGDLARLERTALKLGDVPARAFLRRCASATEALEGLAAGDALDAQVRKWLSGGIDDIAGNLETVCGEGGFDRSGLEWLADVLSNWRTKQGTPNVAGGKAAAHIRDWLAAAPAERVQRLDELRLGWLKQDGDFRSKEPDDPDYRPTAERLDAWIDRLVQLAKAMQLAPVIADALRIGREYARAYSEAKRVGGFVDFDDLIGSTVRLLKMPGIGDWIRYKLDQTVDHILVDEAQDTNARQWEIVKALADEFFAGAGQKEGVRTIFSVGDFKQAIFGFQGTDPREFEKATDHFASLAQGAEQELHRLALSDSWRSSPPVLEVTDAVIGALGYEALGLGERPALHNSAISGPGSVVLLDPVTEASNGDDDDTAESESEEGEGRFTKSEVRWAEMLAARVRAWIDGGLWLNVDERVVEPGDILILVRSRGRLARLIVSCLYQQRVPVAGVDRLRLSAPIAVQDLLACVRFVLQPGDDLSLAALLVSPLVGWTQDELYQHAFGRTGKLWSHLGKFQPEVLREMLAMADRVTPYRFLESILSGPIGGRRKLIAQLGEEARDPIEALLNAALEFEQQPSPSLQQFINWFDSGDVEIKRDPSKPENAVRVMTVHGAKGLQAPVVVLADATRDPDNKMTSELAWSPVPELTFPLFRPRKEEWVGSLIQSAQDQDARDREEHWRLLYVALTRAEEHLFVGGALSKKQQGKPLGEGVWHGRISDALQSLGAVRDDDADALVWRRDAKGRPRPSPFSAFERWSEELPDWTRQFPPQESRPPRPLAPSALGAEDREASPPPDPDQRKAAERGVRLHALLERLPEVAPLERRAAADLWLKSAAGVESAEERAGLVAHALEVIEHPDFAAVFGRQSLAEVPITGVVDGNVIAGTVDRLLIGETGILVVDFKTGRRVPLSAARVSDHHKAQMGAYAAVLSAIFPGKPVRAALLYTSGPRLIELDAETLARFKPGFAPPQQLLSPAS